MKWAWTQMRTKLNEMDDSIEKKWKIILVIGRKEMSSKSEIKHKQSA